MNLHRGIHKEGDVGARHFQGQCGGFQRCRNVVKVHLHSGGSGRQGGVQFHGGDPKEGNVEDIQQGWMVLIAFDLPICSAGLLPPTKMMNGDHVCIIIMPRET
jgi:hypothetical protein